MPGEVGQLSLVAAMNASRKNAARWARCLAPACRGNDKQASGLCDEPLNGQLLRRGKKRDNPGSIHDRNTASTTTED